ncbi:PA4642 family protein [Endozoicomonadaceae bacterium StTr2]
MKKDKQKVIGEALSDEQIKSLLELKGAGEESDDFYVLLQAYRRLRAEDFVRFVGFFKSAGRNVESVGKEGRTIADEIALHQNGKDYLQAF